MQRKRELKKERQKVIDMKKGEFYVFCVNNDGKKEVQTRRGYIDEEHNIAYSHIGKLSKNGELVEFDLGFWNATDLVSGIIMAKGNTKKECIENAIKNIPMLNEAWRGKQSYGDLVEEFKRLKAEKGIFN